MTGGGETRESVVPSSLVSEPPRPMPAQAELTIGEEDGRAVMMILVAVERDISNRRI